MSISNRIIECINKYNSDDLENALIQICIAFSGTAKNEFPYIHSDSGRFMSFIKANMDIITFFTFNTNVFIDCQFGEYSIDRFIYKVLRCGLVHEGEMPIQFRFTEPGEPVILSDKLWSFPKTFIFGSMLSVIGAASNVSQKISDQYSVTIFGKRFLVNDLWGHSDIIRQAIGPPVSNILLK